MKTLDLHPCKWEEHSNHPLVISSMACWETIYGCHSWGLTDAIRFCPKMWGLGEVATTSFPFVCIGDARLQDLFISFLSSLMLSASNIIQETLEVFLKFFLTPLMLHCLRTLEYGLKKFSDCQRKSEVWQRIHGQIQWPPQCFNSNTIIFFHCLAVNPVAMKSI